jgi:hypothetical protein
MGLAYSHSRPSRFSYAVVVAPIFLGGSRGQINTNLLPKVSAPAAPTRRHRCLSRLMVMGSNCQHRKQCLSRHSAWRTLTKLSNPPIQHRKQCSQSFSTAMVCISLTCCLRIERSTPKIGGSKGLDHASSCPSGLLFRQAHTWLISASTRASSLCVTFHAFFDFQAFTGMSKS